MRFTLAVPFIERCFQLAAEEGFVGIFTPGSFAKRESGKPLVESVLPAVELTSVVDASGAYVPGHATPMLVLLGRKRAPRSETVRVVGAKHGEPMVPHDPATGEVWSRIVAHLDTSGYEDDYISVFDVPRSWLATHPWTLSGGTRAAVLRAIEGASPRRLQEAVARVQGAGASSGLDEVFVIPRDVAVRLGIEREVLRPCVSGESLRDWAVEEELSALAPYGEDGAKLLSADPQARWWRYLWRYRAVLRARIRAGASWPEIWWAWSRWPGIPARGSWRLMCPAIARDNHFVLDRSGVVLRETVASVELLDSASEEEALALLAYLNSSAVCCWLKQTSPERGEAAGNFYPGRGIFDFGARVSQIPVPRGVTEAGPLRGALSAAARRIDTAARERRACSPERVLARWDGRSREELLDALGDAQMREIASLRAMVVSQEEIDWRVYEALGLITECAETPSGSALPEERPFAWLSESAPAGLDRRLFAPWTRRREILRAHPAVQTLEDVAFKRRFGEPRGLPAVDVEGEGERPRAAGPRIPRGEAFRIRIVQACEAWLLDRMEDVFRGMESLRLLTADEILSSLLAGAGVSSVVTLWRDPGSGGSLAAAVQSLLERHAVSSPSRARYTRGGQVTRAAWERTWELERREDAGEESERAVPPRYRASDYRDSVTWRHRGKLDVPTERFVRIPGAAPDGRAPMYGWAGWDAEQRFAALSGVASERQAREQWSAAELAPLLDTMSELGADAPRVADWHDQRSLLQDLSTEAPAGGAPATEPPGHGKR